MDAEQANAQADPTPTLHSPKLLDRWGRPLAVATAILFFNSLMFPVATGLSKDTTSFPSWWGILDVGLAFVLAILALVIVGLARDHVPKAAEDATYRAYRILILGILALLAVFFLFGDRIVWINCLTGLAWRTWLLLHCLPAWFTVLSRSPVA
jgi:hypothetical protein